MIAIKARWAALGAMCLALTSYGMARSTGGARIVPAAGSEWLNHGRSYDQQRFSPLARIDRGNVDKLGLAWWAEFDTDRGQEATPLVQGGVLYTTTAWSKVFAFDARTGRKLWSYDPKVPGEKAFDACCDVVNRGPALWNGRLYVATLDGRLIALDARTGKPVWKVSTVDASTPYTITGAPLAVKGLIVIGNAGADKSRRGYVSAYNAVTGKLAWRFFMAPHPQGKPDGAASDKPYKAFAAKSWGPGAWQQGGGGGSPWDALTYDPKTNLVFVGTGNAAPWNDKYRDPTTKGDNLFTASIVALRPETGEYVWHYQTSPRDAWDYDAVQQLMVADLPLAGTRRHVVMQANKNGFYYVLDAATGKVISAEKYIAADWAERIDLATGRPVEAPMARYHAGASTQMPGPLGGHNWQPMAFNPRRGLVYIPTQIARGYYTDPDGYEYGVGLTNTGMGARLDRPPSPNPPAGVAPAAGIAGELLAWDPVAQKPAWRVGFPQYWRSGVLATAGDLVFHSAGPDFMAFDAGTGKVLWRYDTVAWPIAPAISYEVGGEQYVALMVGYGGAAAYGGNQPRRPGRLMVFKLGGKAVPEKFAEVPVPGPLDLAEAIPSTGKPAAGAALYVRLCAACHRVGDYVPNLARTPMILRPDSFNMVVLDGALKANGMASFKRFLTAAQAEDIRAYLLGEAKIARERMQAPVASSGDHAQ